MFYKKGVDITSDKQMFDFLKNHFTYYTMNSWNRLTSIANNVKIHNLGLSGDCFVALDLLENGEYDSINYMVSDWEREHPYYKVIFNGRSNGYLVLTNYDNVYSILPDEINESEDYEEYKRYCKEFYGSVKANRDGLRFYTQLVQDFDKLCDELRDYCEELSNQPFEVIEMQKSVAQFNSRYEDDLYFLGFEQVMCDEHGAVNISEISAITALREAFFRLAGRDGYTLVVDDDENVILRCGY